MRSLPRVCILIILFASAACLVASAVPGSWLFHVPAVERERANPLAADPDAVEAGARLYANHCASCHGRQAEGIGRRPGLKTARVHDARDGELQWLLRNGSLGEGMPAWSSLPEIQRWQLVRYLHSLPISPSN